MHPHKSKSFGILIPAVMLLVAAVTAKPSLFYVATNGNDQWSGRLGQPAANGKDGPLASVSAVVRAMRRDESTNGKTVLVRGGGFGLGGAVTAGMEGFGNRPALLFR